MKYEDWIRYEEAAEAEHARKYGPRPSPEDKLRAELRQEMQAAIAALRAELLDDLRSSIEELQAAVDLPRHPAA